MRTGGVSAGRVNEKEGNLFIFRLLLKISIQRTKGTNRNNIKLCQLAKRKQTLGEYSMKPKQTDNRPQKLLVMVKGFMLAKSNSITNNNSKL